MSLSHRPQLDVGVLQHLMNAIGHARALPLELSPVTRQVPQLALRPGRHEAATQQAALQQLRNPLTVFDIGLPPRNLLQFAGVDQQQLEPAVEDVPHRFP